ncbi:hypothetical protein [Aliiroseovarius crassostreae]|nr:hypothetical protein [Aliiroseovarius crassostreae]
MKEVFMRSFAIIAVLMSGLFLPTAAGAEGGFVVDMERKDIQRLDGSRFLSDILVGETAEVSYLPMCLQDRAMILYERVTLSDKPSHAIRIFVTRETETDVKIEMTATDQTSPCDIRRHVTRFSSLTCKEKGEEAAYWGAPQFRVLSINGATSFTVLLKTPPFAGAMLGQ